MAVWKEWCFRTWFSTVRLYWARDNLGEWVKVWYESCPRCRIDYRSTCWPAVQRATTELRLPPAMTSWQRLCGEGLVVPATWSKGGLSKGQRGCILIDPPRKIPCRSLKVVVQFINRFCYIDTVSIRFWSSTLSKVCVCMCRGGREGGGHKSLKSW